MNEYIAFRTGASYTRDPGGSARQAPKRVYANILGTFKMLFHVILYVESYTAREL